VAEPRHPFKRCHFDGLDGFPGRGRLFFYQARADDMIITAGYNVGGPEVEDALL
jgi:acyl-CoA synthetase (AMP-forming)/AMP-acid ligase II